jgi:hypothetical protein
MTRSRGNFTYEYPIIFKLKNIPLENGNILQMNSAIFRDSEMRESNNSIRLISTNKIAKCSLLRILGPLLRNYWGIIRTCEIWFHMHIKQER